MLSKRTMMSWIIGLATLVALTGAQSRAEEEKIIEGYSNPCGTYLANSSPVIELRIYGSPEDAKKSWSDITSAPMIADAIVDAGPGYQVMNLFSESQTRKICEVVKWLNGERKITLVVNQRNVIKSLTVGDHTVHSDAYILKPESQQKLIKSLTDAYIVQNNAAYNCELSKAEAKVKESSN